MTEDAEKKGESEPIDARLETAVFGVTLTDPADAMTLVLCANPRTAKRTTWANVIRATSSPDPDAAERTELAISFYWRMPPPGFDAPGRMRSFKEQWKKGTLVATTYGVPRDLDAATNKLVQQATGGALDMATAVKKETVASH